jgi:hypothetical protein
VPALGSFTADDRTDLQATKGKVLSLGAATLVVRTPVLEDGSVEIVRGGD